MANEKLHVRFSLLQCLLIGSSTHSTMGFTMDNFRRHQHVGFSFDHSNSSPPLRRESSNHQKIQLRKQQQQQRQCNSSACYGWLENFFEPNKSSSTNARQLQYPEQYPATYKPNDIDLEEDDTIPEAQLVRPLLKNTQLQSRALQLVYDANRDGWNPTAFHRAVDGKGASVVISMDRNGRLCGGYNPKGQSSLGGARPSVAAFLFYERQSEKDEGKTTKFQKLQKVGGGGLACARDDPNFGISFGPDSLVIGLQVGREKVAQSKLGPYFERGPEDLPSLFWESGGATELKELKVLVGCYNENEEIPYSGGVLDMTSG